MADAVVLPRDEFNEVLVRNVHPPGRVNPRPAGRYHLVVIGAGAGGLVTAVGAASLGAKVALVERHLLGGDCLNVGCVPSKAMIRASRVVEEIRKSPEYGIEVRGSVDADFGAVMRRMRRVRAQISRVDSVQRLEGLGIDVFLGQASFSGDDTVAVDGQTLRFRKAVIAAGGRPHVPDVPGMPETGFLTNETIFSLTERPGHLLVLGGGPIGCELAQAFRRLGSQVTVVTMDPHFLPREDADAAEILDKRFHDEGIRFHFNSILTQVEKAGGRKRVTIDQGGADEQITLDVDEILVAAGRVPNVESLNLEAAGVAYDERGVRVSAQLRTTNRRVYAVGDICLPFKFTHVSGTSGALAIQNALFRGRKKWTDLVVPWCTYTDPEIAHVGLYERDAKERGIPVDTFVHPLRHVDRALLDGDEEGFAKVHVRKGTDRILGATIVARHAGELISEYTLAITGKLGLKVIAATIHPYPTQAEAVFHTAIAYQRSRLTPRTKKFLALLLRLLA